MNSEDVKPKLTRAHVGAAAMVAMVAAVAGPEAVASILPRGRRKERSADPEAVAAAREKRERRRMKRLADRGNTLYGRDMARLKLRSVFSERTRTWRAP